ncbi:hypothetical protein [Caballeronia mineralivorans]|uniref:hypothetical protein n=1 Tax=Caballeronia mineralivorans TaxID=2010198 RepID=UPI00069F0FAE|nr:hypothetical protein [Caballeronia mineralivorans]
MQTQDKAEFTQALNLCCSTLRQPLPEPNALKLWFKMLAPYSIEQVRGALRHHMQTGRFAPVPVDVIGYIDKSIDCWVSDNEAWAIAKLAYAKPGDPGRNTVVVCNEIEQALDHVRHLLDEGDNFNASRAFRDCYTRIVDVARQKQQKPRWRVSLGTDNSQHETVIGKAVNEGRIALADGRAAFPLLACPGDNKPIDPKIAAKNHSKIAEVMAVLSKPRAAAPARDKAPEISEAEQQKAEQKRRVEEYQASEARKHALDEREAALALREAALTARDPWAVLSMVACRPIDFPDLAARVKAIIGGNSGAPA